MGNVVSFVSAIESRAGDISRRRGLNTSTVTLSTGQEVAQRALTVLPHQHRLAQVIDDYGAVTHDAEVSGVPLRIAHEAWMQCRVALNAVGAGIEAAGIERVAYGGAYGDCRKLALTRHERVLGTFSILDGRQPRTAASIQADLMRLMAH